MEWLNLHASTMDSPEFVGSDTKERGTWLSLLRYCIGQENGGTISGCKLWKDRQWQQLARVTLREVSIDCRLYEWSSQDLIVWGYPKEKESEVCRKRELARLNGKTGGRPKIGYETITNKEPTLVISQKAEGNGMEGEWKENGMELAQAATPPAKKSAKVQKEEVPPMPEHIATPELLAAWENWQAVRRESKKPITKRIAEQSFRDFALWGAASAIESIAQSIRGGYQGLFPPKNLSYGTAKKPAVTSAEMVKKLNYQEGM